MTKENKPVNKTTKEYNKYNKDYLFKYKHGFERDEALALLREQNGCKICGIKLDEENRGWYMDHDHTCCVKNTSCENCRRGILCRDCNLMLGFAKDDIEILAKAVEYIQTYKEKLDAKLRPAGKRSTK